jgi:hypothetical protein
MNIPNEAYESGQPVTSICLYSFANARDKPVWTPKLMQGCTAAANFLYLYFPRLGANYVRHVYQKIAKDVRPHGFDTVFHFTQEFTHDSILAAQTDTQTHAPVTS